MTRYYLAACMLALGALFLSVPSHAARSQELVPAGVYFATALHGDEAAPSSAVAREALRYVGANSHALGLPASKWCADFANMVLRKTGHATVATRRASAMAAAGRHVRSPQPGDLLVQRHHVSIVVRTAERGQVLTVNGNGRGRRVTLSYRSASGFFVRPIASQVALL